MDFKLDSNVQTIAIYGANATGLALKTYIEENYPDVTIKYFVDATAKDFKTYYNITNLTPEEFFPRAKEVDRVIIAPFNQSQNIKHILLGNGIKHFEILPNWFEVKAIEKLLKSQDEKDLFNIVYKARRYNNENIFTMWAIDNLTIDTHSYTSSRQYLDFVNKDVIKTALDCGGMNGYTSMVFSDEFPNAEKIYCFEPFYQKFATIIPGINGPSNLYKDIIKKSNKIEIVEKGVWSEETTLAFFENRATPGGSTVVPKGNKDRFDKHEIPTTTIDQFKQDKNIDKIDYIKMDIESAELKALIGGTKTIINDRPQLSISIYHSLGEYISIPLYLKSICKDYEFHIGHYSRRPYETVFYAIPKELIK